MAYLNQGVLPPGYFAETQIHFGNRIEVDVAALENSENRPLEHDRNGGLAVETLTETEVLVMPAVFPDYIEIQVFEETGGANLVGAIELVSPANKDRPETKRAFAAKCAAYLQAKIGLLVIDVVSDRRGNLHNELIKLLEQNQSLGFPTSPSLYTVCIAPSAQRTEAIRSKCVCFRWKSVKRCRQCHCPSGADRTLPLT